jgi:hypothetical protein
MLPGWQSVPLFNGQGLVVMLLLHASVAEWLYYWFHRSLHHHWLYTRYHSHHHQSFVTEPITGMSPAELSLLPFMHSLVLLNWKPRKRHLEGVGNAESATLLLQRVYLVMQDSSIFGKTLQGFCRPEGKDCCRRQGSNDWGHFPRRVGASLFGARRQQCYYCPAGCSDVPGGPWLHCNDLRVPAKLRLPQRSGPLQF